MAENGKRRVLIVDDDPLICTILGESLESQGYAVDKAGSAPEAMGKLASDFDAVLSDINMPGASGIELLQQLRQRNPRLVVFLMTGYPTLETVIDAKHYGAVGYFRKPVNLTEVAARLRGALGDEQTALICGQVAVLGEALMARLADRLVRFEVLVGPEEESAFLQLIAERRPKAVLADAAAATTAPLLRAYRSLGSEANSFVLLGDEGALDAISEMLFGNDGVACLSMEASQVQLEQCIQKEVARREAEQLSQRSQTDAAGHRCSFAKPYRNGYYCVHLGGCPYGPFQGGWIAVDGREHQKCRKRPLLLDSLEQVGFTAWTGRIGSSQSIELRRQLLGLVRAGKREILIDAQGLEGANFSLIEILSDAHAELVKTAPTGTISIINASEVVLEEFQKATLHEGIRFFGLCMVDAKSAFKQWGSRVG